MIFDLLRKGTAKPLTSAELAKLIGSGAETFAGRTVSPEVALRYAYVFMCVRVLAEGVGALPLRLMRRQGATRDEAVDHPLHPLLRIAPNAFQTSQEWLERLITHLALRGNSYDWINWIDDRRGGQRVYELLPLAPDGVSPRWNADGSDIEYEVTFRGNRGSRVLSSREVFHCKLLSQDGLVGLSPVAQSRENIGVGLALEENAGRFFANGSRPGGLLSTEQVLGKEGRKEVAESWNEQNQGASKAFRIAVLEHGLKYQQIGLSAEDSQMLESRKLSKVDICGIFKVPPHFIADLERATFGNIEHQDLSFGKHTLTPYLTRIEQRIRFQLLPPAERASLYVKFNLDALLRGDALTRSQALAMKVDRGALSPNEWRELDDQNPRPGGDIYLTPANFLIDGKAPPPTKPGVPS